MVMMDLDQNLFPSTANFGLLSVFIGNITSSNIHAGVMINDNHCHLRGVGGRVFIKELHNSHVGHACNDCIGSTICRYQLECIHGILIDSTCIFAYGSTSFVANCNYHVRFRKGWSHETDNRK